MKRILMIIIQPENLFEITGHGERDYPYECCGLLLGSFSEDGTKVVTEIHTISNARDEEAKRRRFLITPEELLRGERYAQNSQLEVVGFYHSHPDHPAVPSVYDRDHALPIYSYIVLSVSAGKTDELRSWELSADRSAFVEEILKGVESCQ
jgi:proteasome lid subunit RPN8/RPN11